MDEEEEFAIDRDLYIRVHSTQVAIVVEIITILFDISKKFLYIVEDKKKMVLEKKFHRICTSIRRL